MRKILRAAGLVLAVVMAAAACALAFLVFPMSPQSTTVLSFDRFIKLPGHGALNVMDYITISGRSLFVTAESSGSVYKINLAAPHNSAPDAVSELVGKAAAHGVAVVPATGVAFVSRSDANLVEAFDSVTLKKLGSIPVPEDADAIIYDPAAKLIYLANGDPAAATLIDPAKKAVVGTIRLGGKPEFPVFDAKSGLIFQNLNDRNAVAAVDVTTRAVIGHWPLTHCIQPTGLALDVAYQRLFAVCKGNARLVVFAIGSHQVVADLPVGDDPDVVAFDLALRRLYVTGKAGTLTIIQQDLADKYRVLANVQTHYGAHTLAVDPVTHKVYVAYASLFIGPRLAVFSAK